MKSRFLMFVGLGLCSALTFASNLSFLNSTAITFFRGNDKNMMVMNITKSLDNTRDGVKSKWVNQATGSWGYAMPSESGRSHGSICRNLTIFNSANNVTGLATYRFCKISGVWRIVE